MVLAVAVAAFLAILPLASESNPEFEAAQQFLDQLSAATVSIRNGASPSDFEFARDGFVVRSAPVDDAKIGTVLVGSHASRCFVVHWQTPGVSGPRAGVLEPSLRCDASPELMDTLPTPPLVEVFPGTIPPIDVAQLVTRVGAPRHGTFEPFPAERTRLWYLPAAAILFGVVLWQFVGLTIKLLRRRSHSASLLGI